MKTELLGHEPSFDNKQQKKTSNPILRTVELLCLTVALVTVAWVSVEMMDFTAQTTESNRFIEKKAIKSKLSAIIKNGAKLDLVKHAYEVNPFVHRRLFRRIDENQYYTDKTTLASILNDINVDYLSQNPFVEDSLFFANLSSIIQDNHYQNPFDNLEDSQKSYFENVRIVMGDNYELIQDNMNKIGAELSNKNQLVSKYLNRSNVSFIISIVALALTIILSIIQLFQGQKTNKLIGQIMAPQEKNSSIGCEGFNED